MGKNAVLGTIFLGLFLSLWLITFAQSVSDRPGHPISQDQDEKFDQMQELAELRKQIGGKERTPAEDVFKNIQDYKGVPAASLLRGMELYTRALGVDCRHCHVVDQWEKDDKPTKQIAREMAAMVDGIQESLRKIKSLKSERPGISCVTCHRGQLKPAISLPAPLPK